MGHHGTGKSSLVPLIDRLNRYPIGLVDNDRLRAILAHLFDEREAYVASRFPLTEATLNELCRATGMDGHELTPILERMADKGLIMDLPYGGTTYYLLLPGLIGFFELTFMKERPDLPMAEVAQLMSDYLFADPAHGQAREFFGSATPLTRSLVYDETVPVASTVTSADDARAIVRAADYGAVGLCYCRHKKEHLGQHCDKAAPVEGVCISLGSAARFLVRRGFAEPKSGEELVAILDRARSLGLTHITDNVRHKPSFICNCCSCCCELLAGVQAGYHEGVAKSGFVAKVDEAHCTGCGLCVTACNTAAIALSGPQHKAVVQVGACLGCGVCVPACARRALTMIERPRPEPPHNKRELLKRILREKGRLTPYMIRGLQKKVRGWLGR